MPAEVKIINIMAVSIDGKIASHPLESDAERMESGFVNKKDHELVEQELYLADAVISGARSIRASGKIWSVTNDRGILPPWYIYTSRGFDKNSSLWQTKTQKVYLISQNRLIRSSYWGEHVENISFGRENPAKFLCQHLQTKRLLRVVLFGGGEINSLFYKEKLVDRLKLTLVPKIVGLPSARGFLGCDINKVTLLDLEATKVSGNHVFLSYNVRN